MANGILLLNKGMNITSNQIINKIKHELNNNGCLIKKIGHAGTLDPNATGLLVVLVNEATKLSDYLLLNDKEYTAEVTIGIKTTTDDIWGEVIDDLSLTNDDLDNIKNNIDNVLSSLVGKVSQIPPMYSSIKYKGKKLYEYARENKTVDLSSKERIIEIMSLKRVSNVTLENGKVKFKINTLVSKGTYIRTLSSMIGSCLGYPSTMSALERNKSGCFNLKDAYSIDDILKGNYHLINMIDSLKALPQVEVDDKMQDDCKNGRKIKYNSIHKEIVLKKNDTLLGIYEKDANSGYYKAKRVWN